MQQQIKKILKDNTTFLKYIVSAGISFGLDVLLFTVFLFLLEGRIASAILISTIGARAISSFLNYFLNRNAVFRKRDGSNIDAKTICKYYALVVIQVLVSGILVTVGHKVMPINPTIIKIPIEIVLFMVNYFVQKWVIFTDKPIRVNRDIATVMLSFISTFTVCIVSNAEDFVVLSNKNNSVILMLIVCIAFLFFYHKFLGRYKKNTPFCILAIILSLLMVFGYSYNEVGTSYLVFGNIAYLFVSILRGIGYYSMIYLALHIVYEVLCTYQVKEWIKNNPFIDLFNKHPFLVSFAVIVICYLPYIIAFYPATMSYDPANQIKEFMGMHTRYLDSIIPLDPNVTFTNFNPIIHTLLIGSCFKMGYLLGNVNFGLFVYTVIQTTIMAAIFSYSISYLKKCGVVNTILFVLLGMYALIPVFPLYAINTNKDTLFSVFTLLYCIKLHDVITHPYDWKKCWTLIAVAMAVVLIRHNGILTIVLSLPFTLIWLKDKRKYILTSLATILFLNIGYSDVLLPALKISDTSIREMLSIPFQQTARYVKYYPEEFSQEDKDIINKVFVFDSYNEIYKPELKGDYTEPIQSFDTFGELYKPHLSDPIKNQYNIYNTNEDLMDYFGVWFKGLLRRPDLYIDATINNVYGFFYPGTSGWYIYYKYNTVLAEAGFDYHYNSLGLIRAAFHAVGVLYPHIPIIGLVVNIAFVAWIYFFLFAALIHKRKRNYIPLLLPALSSILVNIAGPANTYFRYALPYVMSLPVIVCLLYLVFQEKQEPASDHT